MHRERKAGAMANNNFVDESFSNNSNKNKPNRVKARFRLLGQIKDSVSSKQAMGYLVLDEVTKRAKAYTVDQTMALLSRYPFTNAKLTCNKIENTECSMDRLTVYDPHLNILDKPGFTILGRVVNSKGTTLGFEAVNYYGEPVTLTAADISKCDGHFLNCKVVGEGKDKHLSGIRQAIPVIKRETLQNKPSHSPKKVNTKAVKYRKEMHKRKTRAWLANIFTQEILGKTPKYLGHAGIYIPDETGRGHRKYRRELRLDLEMRIVTNELINDIRAELKDSNCKMTDRYETMLNIISNIALSIEKEYKGKPIKFMTDINADLGYKLFVVSTLVTFYADINDHAMFYRMCVQRPILLEEAMRYPQIVVRKGSGKHWDTSIIKKAVKEEFGSNLNNGMLEILTAINKAEAYKKEHEIGVFDVKEFKSAQSMAELGFAISEQNRGFKYNKSMGTKCTLKYIGDYLKDYESYKRNATCLGDVLIPATVETMMKYSDENLSNNAEQRHVNAVRMEMALAILAIYNPSMCNLFFEHHPELSGVFLTGFDPENPVDYELPDKLRLYYESGCCVYYNDMGEDEVIVRGGRSITEKVSYSKERLRKAEVINYRALGPHKSCQCSDLKWQLAPIVNTLTSDNCTAEDIELYIGNLRAL